MTLTELAVLQRANDDYTAALAAIVNAAKTPGKRPSDPGALIRAYDKARGLREELLTPEAVAYLLGCTAAYHASLGQ